MNRVLVLKTAALGDVLRTTSILPGLAERFPGVHVTWLTASGARELVSGHRLVHEVIAVDPRDAGSLAEAERAVSSKHRRWDWVISLDDEQELCALAARIACERLSGAYLDAEGRRRYTADVGPWFDMGLLSVHGKAEADRAKIANRRSHPEIHAAMLGLSMGKPELAIGERAERFARDLAARAGLRGRAPLVGLNTGAGGRWPSKELSVERTVALVRSLAPALPESAAFLVLGGIAERARNDAILAGLERLEPRPFVVDTGTENALLEFAGIVSLCDVLVTSDSLALHVAIARGVRIVSFFAPTSAAEIELYGQGEKVLSTAPDYCSYRPDADTATLTPERLHAAVLRVLSLPRAGDLARPASDRR